MRAKVVEIKKYLKNETEQVDIICGLLKLVE